MKFHKNSKILFHTRPDKLGDLILMIPILKSLHQQYGCHIGVITGALGKEFLSSFSFVSDCFEMDINTPGWFSPVLTEIKNRSYDIWISLWNDIKMAYLGYKTRIPIRIGDGSMIPMSFFYTHRIFQDWGNILCHQMEYYANISSPLNLKAIYLENLIPINQEAEKKIKRYFNQITAQKVLIFTETGGTNIPIPMSVTLLLIQQLLAQGYHVTVCAQHFQEGYPEGVLNLTGKGLILEELTALINLCDFYIGGDTAPTHLASFLQKPTLFFSPRKNHPPARWGSFSSFQVILRKEYRCFNPCQQACNSDVCIKWVNVEKIMTCFSELVQDVRLDKKKSNAAIRQYHAIHTLRFLVIEKYDKTNHLFDVLNSKDKVVFLWKGVKFRQLMQYIKDHNINAVAHPIPFWLRWLIKFNMGVIHGVIPPQFYKKGYNKESLDFFNQKMVK